MSFYFYHLGRKVPMSVSASYIAAGYSPGKDTSKLLATLVGKGPSWSRREVVQLVSRGLLLLPMVSGRSDAAAERIRKSDDLTVGPTTFEIGGAVLVPDGLVNADLSNRSAAEIAALLTRFGATLTREPEPSFPHHVLSPDDGDPFGLANRLFEEANIAAQPRFDRLRSVPRASVPSTPFGEADFAAGLWGRKAIGVDAAWEITRGNPEVVVAVLDTGVALQHPDLEPNLIEGIDDIDGDTSPAPDAGDPNAHGTQCAGIIGARSESQFGLAGVAPHGRILPVRMLKAGVDGKFLEHADARARCIRLAVEAHARVISISLGDRMPGSDLDAAVAFAVKQGCVVVAAAGNDNGSVCFPAASPGAIAVAAVNASGERCTAREWGKEPRTRRPYGSCFGEQIFIAAPGHRIATTTIPPSGYTAGFNGTSAACPFVAGAVALMLAKNRDLTVDAIREILMRTAKKIGTTAEDEGGRNQLVGYGQVDVLAAVMRV